MRKQKRPYFTVLREEMPSRRAKKLRPIQLDKSAAFSVAGEKQEKAADEGTVVLLERFSGKSGIRACSKNRRELSQEFRPDRLSDLFPWSGNPFLLDGASSDYYSVVGGSTLFWEPGETFGILAC